MQGAAPRRIKLQGMPERMMGCDECGIYDGRRNACVPCGVDCAVEDRVDAVTRHLRETAEPSPQPRRSSRMTAASHKRVRVVSACDVTVPAGACDLATPCDVDDNSDGAGSATDDRGDDFPGGAYGSGTDSVLDLAQPQAKPLGSTGACGLVVCCLFSGSTHLRAHRTPDALRRIRSHSLLFGACHGSTAPVCVDGVTPQGEFLGSGAPTAARTTTDPHHVWAFLQEQHLADLVTCSISVRPRPAPHARAVVGSTRYTARPLNI
jgi:hypothetical protein